MGFGEIRLAMPMMILNFALLFVFQLAPVEFFFRDRENLLDRFAEFLGWFFFFRERDGRHVTESSASIAETQAATSKIILRLLSLVPLLSNPRQCQRSVPNPFCRNRSDCPA